MENRDSAEIDEVKQVILISDTDEEQDIEEDDKWTPKRVIKCILENVASLGIGIVLAILFIKIVGFVGEIPSESMIPTYNVRDRLYVSRLAYKNKIPDRQDKIVFTGFFNDETLIIKRVIAIPGDTIDFQGGVTILNGEPLYEPYALGDTYSLEDGRMTDLQYPLTIPEGYCFGMGDNRENSCDSRYYGLIKIDNIVGEAKFKIWGA